MARKKETKKVLLPKVERIRRRNAELAASIANIGEAQDEAPAQTSARMRELEAEGVIGPIPNTEPEDHAPIAPVPPKRTKKNPPSSTTHDTAPDDATEIVVFAFRLTRAERDEIHAATGSARASKFIRTLALAGARRDMKAVQEAVDEIHANRQ